MDFSIPTILIGGHRMQTGRDTVHYDMMADPMHRHWRPTGIRGWGDSQWVATQNTVISWGARK